MNHEYTREEIRTMIHEAAVESAYCLAHCRHCSIGSHEHCLLKFRIEREVEKIYADPVGTKSISDAA